MILNGLNSTVSSINAINNEINGIRGRIKALEKDLTILREQYKKPLLKEKERKEKELEILLKNKKILEEIDKKFPFAASELLQERRQQQKLPKEQREQRERDEQELIDRIRDERIRAINEKIGQLEAQVEKNKQQIKDKKAKAEKIKNQPKKTTAPQTQAQQQQTPPVAHSQQQRQDAEEFFREIEEAEKELAELKKEEGVDNTELIEAKEKEIQEQKQHAEEIQSGQEEIDPPEIAPHTETVPQQEEVPQEEGEEMPQAEGEGEHPGDTPGFVPQEDPNVIDYANPHKYFSPQTGGQTSSAKQEAEKKLKEFITAVTKELEQELGRTPTFNDMIEKLLTIYEKDKIKARFPVLAEGWVKINGVIPSIEQIYNVHFSAAALMEELVPEPAVVVAEEAAEINETIEENEKSDRRGVSPSIRLPIYAEEVKRQDKGTYKLIDRIFKFLNSLVQNHFIMDSAFTAHIENEIEVEYDAQGNIIKGNPLALTARQIDDDTYVMPTAETNSTTMTLVDEQGNTNDPKNPNSPYANYVVRVPKAGITWKEAKDQAKKVFAGRDDLYQQWFDQYVPVGIVYNGSKYNPAKHDTSESARTIGKGQGVILTTLRNHEFYNEERENVRAGGSKAAEETRNVRRAIGRNKDKRTPVSFKSRDFGMLRTLKGETDRDGKQYPLQQLSNATHELEKGKEPVLALVYLEGGKADGAIQYVTGVDNNGKKVKFDGEINADRQERVKDGGYVDPQLEFRESFKDSKGGYGRYVTAVMVPVHTDKNGRTFYMPIVLSTYKAQDGSFPLDPKLQNSMRHAVLSGILALAEQQGNDVNFEAVKKLIKARFGFSYDQSKALRDGVKTKMSLNLGSVQELVKYMSKFCSPKTGSAEQKTQQMEATLNEIFSLAGKAKSQNAFLQKLEAFVGNATKTGEISRFGVSFKLDSTKGEAVLTDEKGTASSMNYNRAMQQFYYTEKSLQTVTGIDGEKKLVADVSPKLEMTATDSKQQEIIHPKEEKPIFVPEAPSSQAQVAQQKQQQQQAQNPTFPAEFKFENKTGKPFPIEEQIEKLEAELEDLREQARKVKNEIELTKKQEADRPEKDKSTEWIKHFEDELKSIIEKGKQKRREVDRLKELRAEGKKEDDTTEAKILNAKQLILHKEKILALHTNRINVYKAEINSKWTPKERIVELQGLIKHMNKKIENVKKEIQDQKELLSQWQEKTSEFEKQINVVPDSKPPAPAVPPSPTAPPASRAPVKQETQESQEEKEAREEEERIEAELEILQEHGRRMAEHLKNEKTKDAEGNEVNKYTSEEAERMADEMISVHRAAMIAEIQKKHEEKAKKTKEEKNKVVKENDRKVEGLTIPEQRALVESLKHMTAVVIKEELKKITDKKQAKKAVKEVIENQTEKAIDQKIEDAQKLLDVLNELLKQQTPAADATLSDEQQKSLDALKEYVKDQQNALKKWKAVKEQTQKLKNELNGFWSNLLDVDLSKDTEEDLDMDETGEGNEVYDKNSFETNILSSFSKRVMLEFYGMPRTDQTTGRTVVNELGMTEYISPEDAYVRLLDVASMMNSNWDAMMAEMDRKYNALPIEDEAGNFIGNVFYKMLQIKLKALPQQFKNEIMYKMITDKVTMHKIIINYGDRQLKGADGKLVTDKDGNPVYETAGITIVDENSGRSNIRISRKIKNSFVEKFGIYKDGKVSFNKSFAKRILGELEDLAKTENKIVVENNLGAKRTLDVHERDPEIIKALLDQIGFEPINRNTLENFAVTKDPKTGEFVDNLYGSQGLITLLTKQLKEVIDSSPDAITNSGKENFLNQISTPLNRLISLEVDINDVLLGYSMYVGGKTVNSVAQTSSVSDIVKRISQDPTFVEQLLNTNYAKDNYFLKFLKNEEFLKMLKNLPMPSLEALQMGKRSSGNSEYRKLTEADQLRLLLNLFMYERNKKIDSPFPNSKIKFRMVHLPLITASNKGKTVYMPMPAIRFDTNNLKFDKNTGELIIDEEILNFLTKQVFETELDRVVDSYQSKTGSPYANYDNASKVFYNVSSFNHIQIEMGETDEQGKPIKSNIHELLHDSRGAISEEIRAKIIAEAKNKLKDYFLSETNKKMSQLTQSGIYNAEAQVTQDLNPEFLNAGDKSKMTEYGKLHHSMADFAINNLLTQVAKQQIIYGDVAFYSKAKLPYVMQGSVKKIDVAKVMTPEFLRETIKASAYTLQKRAVNAVAAGNKLADSENPNSQYSQEFTHILLKDRIDESPNVRRLMETHQGKPLNKTQSAAFNRLEKNRAEIEKLKEEKKKGYEQKVKELENKNEEIIDRHFSDIKPYFRITGTDSQQYVTWQFYLEIMERKGEIDAQQRKNLIRKIEGDMELSEEDLQTIERITMNPGKPIYAHNVMDKENNVLRPVYIKSSFFPLFPHLTKGMKLDKLRQTMEKLEKERTEGNKGKYLPVTASYQSSFKVGATSVAMNMDDIYDFDIENNSPESMKGMAESTSRLPMSGFKIQQESPSKEKDGFNAGHDAKVRMASQFFKILMGNFIHRVKDKAFPNFFDAQHLKDAGVEDTEMLTGEELNKLQNSVYFKYYELLLKDLEESSGIDTNLHFDDLSRQEQNRIIEKMQEVITREIKIRGYSAALLDSVGLMNENGKVVMNSPMLFNPNRHKFEALLKAYIATKLITNKLPGNSHVLGSAEGMVFSYNEKKDARDKVIEEKKKLGLIKIPNDSKINKRRYDPYKITSDKVYLKTEIEKLENRINKRITDPELLKEAKSVLSSIKRNLRVLSRMDKTEVKEASNRDLVLSEAGRAFATEGDELEEEKNREYDRLENDAEYIEQNIKILQNSNAKRPSENKEKVLAILWKNLEKAKEKESNVQKVEIHEEEKEDTFTPPVVLREKERRGIVWIKDTGGQLGSTYVTTENGEKRIIKSQILVKSHFKYIDKNGNYNYVDLRDPKYSYINENGNLMLRMDKIDPELLEMFSFRIPTSAHQSGAIAEVVGFLPEECEDLMFAPKEYLIQIGEDYDFDKRYLYKPHYKLNAQGKIVKLNRNNYKERRGEKKVNDAYHTARMGAAKKEREIGKILKELDMLHNASGGEIAELMAEMYVKAHKNFDDMPEDLKNSMFDYFFGEVQELDREQKEEILDRLKEISIKASAEKQMMIELEELLVKLPKQNERRKELKLLENALSDLYKSVFMTTDPTVQRNIMKSLNTDAADQTSRIIDKVLSQGDETDISLFSDIFQLELFLSGAASQTGVGIYSNSIVFEAQLQKIEAVAQGVHLTWGTDRDGKPIKLTIGDLTFGGQFGAKTETLDKRRNINDAHAENQNNAVDDVNKQNMGKRNENTVTMPVFSLMAHMGFDMSKNPVDTGIMENGEIVKTPLHIPSLLMSQPVIRDFVQRLNKRKSIGSGYQANAEEEIFKELMNEYRAKADKNKLEEEKKEYAKEKAKKKKLKELKELEEEEEKEESVEVETDIDDEDRYRMSEGLFQETLKELTGQKLFNMLNKDAALKDSAWEQMAALQLFMNLSKKARELSQIQQLVNVMGSRKLGISYFETLQKISQLNDMGRKALHREAIKGQIMQMRKDGMNVNFDTDKSIQNAHYLIGEVSISAKEGFVKIGSFWWKPTTTEGIVLIHSLKAEQALLPAYFPYEAETVQNVINDIFIHRGLDTEDTGGYSVQQKYDILTELVDFVNAKAVLGNRNATKEKERLFLNNAALEHKSLGMILQEIKKQNKLKGNVFVENLEINYVPEENGHAIHRTPGEMRFNETDEQNAFAELMEDNKTVLGTFNGKTMTPRDLAMDLIRYAYLSDDRKGVVGFKKMIPMSYLNELGISATIRKQFENLKEGNPETKREMEFFITQYFQHNSHLLKTYDSKEKLDEVVERLARDYGPATEEAIYANIKNKTYKVIVRGSGNHEFVELQRTKSKMYKSYDAQQEVQIRAVSDEKNLFNKYVTHKGVPYLVSYEKMNGKTVRVERSVAKSDALISKMKTLKELADVVKQGMPLSKEEAMIFDEVYPYLGESKLEIKELENGELAYYDEDTNTVYISPTIWSSLAEKHRDLAKVRKVFKEILFEEIIHSITVNRLKQHIIVDKNNNILGYKEKDPNKIPNFVTMLVTMFQDAREAVPYSEYDKLGTYYSKNIFEFVAGMFVSEQYRKNLETKNKTFLRRFANSIRAVFSYLWEKDPNKRTPDYKIVFHKAVHALITKTAREDNQGQLSTEPEEIMSGMGDAVVREEISSGQTPLQAEIQEKKNKVVEAIGKILETGIPTDIDDVTDEEIAAAEDEGDAGKHSTPRTVSLTDIREIPEINCK